MRDYFNITLRNKFQYM